MKSKQAIKKQLAGASKTADIPGISGGNKSWFTLLLILLATLLLTLAGPPASQAYLAWVALVPWLVAIDRPTSMRRLFWWNWLAGILFFSANIWWLMKVTVPGGMGLIVFCGFFFALAAMVIRGGGLLSHEQSAARAIVNVLLISATWVACEYVRGTFLSGMPWSFVAHTQTPVLMMCQIADVTGAYGVTFWVVAVNVAIYHLWMSRRTWKRAMPQLAFATALVIGVAGYGWWRLETTHTTSGPTVLVVQSNYPQSYTGEKSATTEEVVDFHVSMTEAALRAVESAGGHVDLVVWSETVMPELNVESRRAWSDYQKGVRLEETYQRLSALAAAHKTGLLTGGIFGDGWQIKKVSSQGKTFEVPVASDMRNSAYFFDDTGTFSEQRYDKIHLVPFGETIPFKDSLPWLYGTLLSFGPADLANNLLVAGAADALTVFELHRPRADLAARPWRFVTPICFEDADGGLVASMFRPTGGEKRADMIINITNDGWFTGPQMRQHLNKAIFRSIENRAPTARAVNTGISGFIDSVGRTSGLLATNVEGTSVGTLAIDERLSDYSRVGDAFAWVCVGVTSAMSAVLVGGALIRRWRRDVQIEGDR